MNKIYCDHKYLDFHYKAGNITFNHRIHLVNGQDESDEYLLMKRIKSNYVKKITYFKENHCNFLFTQNSEPLPIATTAKRLSTTKILFFN